MVTNEDPLDDAHSSMTEDWAVVQTRARCEKKIAALCAKDGVKTYLPLRTKTHRYGARERSFSSPLFPGYVFARADRTACRDLLQQRDVARVLRPADPARLLHQLRQIRDALDKADLPEVLPFLQEGRTVRVCGGSLAGLEGVVARWQGTTRVFLNVEMIGQSVALEVDPQLLEPVL